MPAMNCDHQIFNVFRRMNAPVHRRQVKVVIFLHHPCGCEEIIFRQRIIDIRQPHPRGLRFARVNNNVIFRLAGRR